MKKNFAPALALLFPLLLRLAFLGKQSFDMDESFSWWIASHPLGELVSLLRYDAHPPLFYALLHLWELGGRSEAYLRLVSVACGVVNCALIYALGSDAIDRKTGMLAALFWTCSYAALWNETWCRMYAPAVTLSLGATLAFLKAIRRRELASWALYLCAAALSLYTHYYTGFILAAHWVYLLVEKKWREAVIVPLVLAALFIPWLPVFFFQLSNGVAVPMPAGSWGTLLSAFEQMIWPPMASPSAALHWSLAGAGVLFCCVGAYSLVKEKRSEGLLLPLLFIVPCFAPFAIAQLTSRHIFVSRYFILFAPYFSLLTLHGVLRLPRAAAAPPLVLLILVNLFAWWLFATNPAIQRQDWRKAADLIGSSISPGDDFFVEQTAAIFPLAYYLPGDFTVDWKGDAFAVDSLKPGTNWYIAQGESSIPLAEKAAAYSKRQWLIMCQAVLVDPRFSLFDWFSSHEANTVSYEIQAGPIYVLRFERRGGKKP